MYSYTLDGVPYDAEVSPLGGVTDIQRTITRNIKGTDSDNILRKQLQGTVTLCNQAFNYFCSRLQNGVCTPVEIVIYDENGDVFYSGTIYGYMGNLDLFKRTVEVEVKDTSWSSILRNRTKQEVWIRSERTIGCEPIDRCRYRFFEFGTEIPTGTYTGLRLGFNVLEVLDYVANFLTDNQVGVVSNYLQTNEYAIFTSKVMNTDTITPPGFVSFLTDEEIWPIISFDTLFTELRKKLGLYIMVENTMSGIQLRIEDEAYFYGSSTLLTIPEIQESTKIRTDVDRLTAIVKVGQSDTELKADTPLEFYKERRFYSWLEDTFNSCTCESDKDNELDLISDFVIDSNQIYEALNGFDYGDRLFLVHSNIQLPFSNAVQTFDGANGFNYFNDTLRNPNVITNWGTYLENCIYDVRQSGVQFELQCNPLIDGFACVQSPFAGNTPRSVLGYQTYIDPQDVVVDTDNGYPTDISKPTDLIPGGSFGYKIPVEGYYIFEAQGYWELIVTGTVDTASCTISIVVYSDDTGTTEIYRKDETESFANTGSLVNVQQYVLSDFIQLPAGAVVVVELSSFVDNSVVKSVAQTFQKDFFRFSDAINCFDIPNQSNTYPFIYTLEYPICKSDFDLIDADKKGKVNFAGIDTWIKSVSQKITGETTFELLSNEIICCNE